MNRGKYAYVGLWVKYALKKSSYVSKIPPVPQEKSDNNRFRVPIHFVTNRFSFENFRRRLHCYTLVNMRHARHRWSVWRA